MKICDSTGKESFADSAAARLRLKHLKSRDGYNGEVYACADCNGFHIGRNKLASDKRGYIPRKLSV